jgi:hypothetical protein
MPLAAALDLIKSFLLRRCLDVRPHRCLPLLLPSSWISSPFSLSAHHAHPTFLDRPPTFSQTLSPSTPRRPARPSSPSETIYSDPSRSLDLLRPVRFPTQVENAHFVGVGASWISEVRKKGLENEEEAGWWREIKGGVRKSDLLQAKGVR